MMIEGNTLYLVPARKGSKGLPGKNIKLLGNKPLIAYSIEFALRNANSNDFVCVSTNDLSIISIANNYQISPPFIRPEELCSDTASTFDVISHALLFYENQGHIIDQIVLLQPTSPFRSDADFKSMKKIFFESNCDMVVSVKIAKENPYFTLFKENKKGYLCPFAKNKSFIRRQDCPPVFVYNGSVYIFKVRAFKESNSFNFNKIIKYVMPEERSIDIDTSTDWFIAEYYLSNYYENSEDHP